MQHEHDLLVRRCPVDFILYELLHIREYVTDVGGCVAKCALDDGFNHVEDDATGLIVDTVDGTTECKCEFIEVTLHPVGPHRDTVDEDPFFGGGVWPGWVDDTGEASLCPVEEDAESVVCDDECDDSDEEGGCEGEEGNRDAEEETWDEQEEEGGLGDN